MEAPAVRLKFVEAAPNPTPVEWMHNESGPELEPHALACGTRDSLKRGGRRLLARPVKM